MSETSSDSGPEDRNLPKGKKRAKVVADKDEKSKKEPASNKRKKEEKEDEGDDDGGKIPLGSKRFVSISEFRGKTLIDIREWYGDDADDLKPGKKGISLSKEQFEKLLAVGPTILKKASE